MRRMRNTSLGWWRKAEPHHSTYTWLIFIDWLLSLHLTVSKAMYPCILRYWWSSLPTWNRTLCLHYLGSRVCCQSTTTGVCTTSSMTLRRGRTPRLYPHCKRWLPMGSTSQHASTTAGGRCLGWDDDALTLVEMKYCTLLYLMHNHVKCEELFAISHNNHSGIWPFWFCVVFPQLPRKEKYPAYIPLRPDPRQCKPAPPTTSTTTSTTITPPSSPPTIPSSSKQGDTGKQGRKLFTVQYHIHFTPRENLSSLYWHQSQSWRLKVKWI